MVVHGDKPVVYSHSEAKSYRYHTYLLLALPSFSGATNYVLLICIPKVYTIICPSARIAVLPPFMTYRLTVDFSIRSLRN